MNYNHFELLQIQAEALYVYNAENRMVRINESDPNDPAPRFFLARSMKGNLCSTRYDLPVNLTLELERLAAAEPVVDDLREPPYYAENYKELLQQHAPIHNIEGGPAYYLPELDPPSSAVRITPENMTLLKAHYPYTLSTFEECSPIVVMVVDGTAVSACFTARNTARVAEAGVYTVDTYRGRGYALETVRGWAGAIRALGKLPFYSTSWSNTASQAVATKLGAVQYGADFNIT